MNRREFFLGSLGAYLVSQQSAFAMLARKSQTATESLFLVGHGIDTYTKIGKLMTTTSTQTELRITRGSGEQRIIQTPCRGHEITIHPHLKNIVFIPSKWGREACLADLKKNKLIKTFYTDEKVNFYGHSVYSSDGRYILVSMVTTNDGEGFISVRDSSTLSEVKRIPTYGIKPHQISWLVPDKVIAAVNAYSSDGKSPAGFNLIDVNSSRLLKSYNLRENGCSHFIFDSGKKNVLIGRHVEMKESAIGEFLHLDSNVSLACSDAPKLHPEVTEVLGMIICEEKNLACIGVTGLKKIIFWNFKHNQIVHQEATEGNPMGFGITSDKKSVYVCIGTRPNQDPVIRTYDYQKFFQFNLRHPVAEVRGGNGSHLTVTQI